MPQYNSNQQDFFLSLPWRLQSTLGSDTAFAQKLMDSGASAASVLSATTTKAYLEHRRSQAKNKPIAVFECKSLADFDKQITNAPMHSSVVPRFKVGSGDLWQTVVEVAGPDSGRGWLAGGPDINIFIVLDEWGGGVVQRVDVVTRSKVLGGNLRQADSGTWLTIVHALGHTDGIQQRTRSSSLFDEIPTTRARR